MMKWIGYIFYAVFLGPIWDLTCPENTDFGSSTGGPRLGTSWLLLAFCEEFGWAGLLFPAARRAFPGFRSFIYSWLLTSAIWVSWHVPFIIAGGNSLNNTIIPEVTEYHPGAPNLLSYAPYTDDSPTPLWWGLIGFTLDLFMARLCICILTTSNKAGIFPALLFHAGHNMLIESFMVQVLRPSMSRPRRARIYAYVVGESGLFQIMAYVLCAIMLYRWRRHRMPPLHLLPANVDEPLASNQEDRAEFQQEDSMMQDSNTGSALEVGRQSSYRGQVSEEKWPPTEAVRPL
jgi:membrane protease YdiL (CAAX protease family)